MMHDPWRDIADACIYDFPDVTSVDSEGGDLITIGADLEPSTLLYAYSHALFPMNVHVGETEEQVLGWFSPITRAIFPLDDLRVTRSMKQSAKKYECRVDTCFTDIYHEFGDCVNGNICDTRCGS